MIGTGPSASVIASKSASPGAFTQRPFTAVVSSPGTSQYASKPRKWSMRTTSKFANIARIRRIHHAKPSAAIRSHA